MMVKYYRKNARKLAGDIQTGPFANKTLQSKVDSILSYLLTILRFRNTDTLSLFLKNDMYGNHQILGA